MSRYIDILGKDYREFARAFYKQRVAEKVPAEKIPEFMRDVTLYMKEKLKDDKLPLYVKFIRAIEHCTRRD